MDLAFKSMQQRHTGMASYRKEAPISARKSEAGTADENPRGTDQCLWALDCQGLRRHRLQMFGAVLSMELLLFLQVDQSMSGSSYVENLTPHLKT